MKKYKINYKTILRNILIILLIILIIKYIKILHNNTSKLMNIGSNYTEYCQKNNIKISKYSYKDFINKEVK